MNLIPVPNKAEITSTQNISVGNKILFLYMYPISGFEIVEIIANFDNGWLCRYDLLSIGQGHFHSFFEK